MAFHDVFKTLKGLFSLEPAASKAHQMWPSSSTRSLPADGNEVQTHSASEHCGTAVAPEPYPVTHSAINS